MWEEYYKNQSVKNKRNLEINEDNMSKISLNRYSEFVESITSNESNDFDAFNIRLQELNDQGVHISLLLTSALGLPAESAEFAEYVKKLIFQRKPFTEENKVLMVKELGDVFWYLVNACRALGVDPYDVLNENVTKLLSRFPAGKFDANSSENRASHDK